MLMFVCLLVGCLRELMFSPGVGIHCLISFSLLGYSTFCPISYVITCLPVIVVSISDVELLRWWAQHFHRWSIVILCAFMSTHRFLSPVSIIIIMLSDSKIKLICLIFVSVISSVGLRRIVCLTCMSHLRITLIAIITVVAVGWAAWLIIAIHIVFVPIVAFNTVIYCVYLLIY